jgi:hypothetical protein
LSRNATHSKPVKRPQNPAAVSRRHKKFSMLERIPPGAVCEQEQEIGAVNNGCEIMLRFKKDTPLRLTRDKHRSILRVNDENDHGELPRP